MKITDFQKPELPELDQLLSSALRHARELRREKLPAETKQIHDLIQSTYSDPRNWTPGRKVAFVHRDQSTGAVTLLGVFQELVYHRGTVEGRRLSPLPAAENLHADITEVVSGDHWLSPKETPRYVEDAHEIIRLKARFEELLAEFPS